MVWKVVWYHIIVHRSLHETVWLRTSPHRWSPGSDSASSLWTNKHNFNYYACAKFMHLCTYAKSIWAVFKRFLIILMITKCFVCCKCKVKSQMSHILYFWLAEQHIAWFYTSDRMLLRFLFARVLWWQKLRKKIDLLVMHFPKNHTQVTKWSVHY